MTNYYHKIATKNWLYCLLIELLLFYGLFLIWQNINHEFILTVFNVPNGDALFIKTPEGHSIAIDSGDDNTASSKIFKSKHFFDRTIDALIITHPHADHIGGTLEIMKNFQVKNLFLTNIENNNPLYAELIKSAQDEKVNIIFLDSSLSINAGITKIDVLHPNKKITENDTKDDPNNSSLVLRLSIYNQAILLTGDVETKSENSILHSDKKLSSKYLKVGHQGSKTSTTPEFLAAIAPNIALISVSKDNPYGHPHAEVIERLKISNIATYLTRDSGDIKIEIYPQYEKILFEKI